MNNAQLRTVVLCGKQITYSFVRKKIKRVNLRVKADLSVTVSAPLFYSAAKADQFITEHAEFVIKNLRKFASREQKECVQPRFSSDENIIILGKPYTLRLLYGENKICFSGDELLIFTPEAAESEAKIVFDKFVFSECKRIFTALINYYYPYFKKYVGEKLPSLTLRSMTSVWGTCNPKKNKITLNLKLYFKPIKAIEYVVVHEYCHYIQLNHSPAFYAEVKKVMPDYKERLPLLKNIN